MKKIKHGLFFSMIFILSVTSYGLSQDTKTKKLSKLPLKYKLLETQVNTEDNDRQVDILIAKEAFTKENILLLIRHLSKRFPKPLALSIDVYTDLDDWTKPGTSGMSSRKVNIPDKGHRAISVRLEDGSYGSIYLYFSDGSFMDLTDK